MKRVSFKKNRYLRKKVMGGKIRDLQKIHRPSSTNIRTQTSPRPRRHRPPRSAHLPPRDPASPFPFSTHTNSANSSLPPFSGQRSHGHLLRPLLPLRSQAAHRRGRHPLHPPLLSLRTLQPCTIRAPLLLLPFLPPRIFLLPRRRLPAFSGRNSGPRRPISAGNPYCRSVGQGRQ
jgi:hypothetical protein